MKTNKIKILSLLGVISIIPSIVTQQFFEKNPNISLDKYSSKNQEVNTNIIDMETGNNLSGAMVDSNGDGKGDSVYMWGSNLYGQLGQSKEDYYYNDPLPQKIEGLPEGEIVDFSIGDSHIGVVIDTTFDGKGDSLYMWGDNGKGQLGHEPWTNGDDDFSYPFNWNPMKVEGLPEGEIVDFSLGGNNSGVVIDTNDDGKGDSLYMWGDNWDGQLGHEPGTNGDNVDSPYQWDINWNPVKVEGLPEGEIVDFSIGYLHVGAVIDTTFDGKGDSIYMWGDNELGQLGHEQGTNGDIQENNLGYDSISNSNPIKVEGLPEGEIIDIATGYHHSGISLDINGDSKADTVYSWGENFYGELGHKPGTSGDVDYFNNSTPIEIKSLPEGEIIDISFGTQHSGVIMDTNWDNNGDSIYMWGLNAEGELGHEPGTNGDDNFGTTPYYWCPTKVEGIPEGEIIDISLRGGCHSGITLDTNGDENGDSIYMWGSNRYGELGHELGTNGDSTNIIDSEHNWNPVKVKGIPTFSQDYYFESIDSIEIIDNKSTIIINNNLKFFNNNTVEEREVKLDILDNEENIIEIKTSFDINTGQIIINDSDHQFSNDESYYIKSIKYNSTINNFDGYKYVYYPTSNNTFEVNWSSSNSLWWVWVLLSLIILTSIILVIVWIVMSKKNKRVVIK